MCQFPGEHPQSRCQQGPLAPRAGVKGTGGAGAGVLPCCTNCSWRQLLESCPWGKGVHTHPGWRDSLSSVTARSAPGCSGAVGQGDESQCPIADGSAAQGAIVGLAAGLAMAFWVGIGGFVFNMMASPVAPPASNSTHFPPNGNLTTAVMTTLLTSTTAPPR